MTRSPAAIRSHRWHLTTLLCLTLLGFFSHPIAAEASTRDIKEMADVCMYAQRILKDYALIGMGVTYHDPATDLKKNAKVVDRYIADIENHHLKASLDKEVRQIQKLWGDIEPRLLAKPDKPRMAELREKVEDFVRECEKVLDDLAEDAHKKGEHEIVLISELGMESQRLAALYIMKAWGVADENYYDEVQSILDEYEKIADELLAADARLVPDDVKAMLRKASNHFRVFDVMAMSKSGRFAPTRAQRSATKIFTMVRKILELEEKEEGL